MCGIVGVVSSTTETLTTQHVLEGLRKLEYRGYDSAGIATIINNQIELRRSVGKIAQLDETIHQNPFSSNALGAIGHTRWATHGEPTETNAHPHITDTCAVVHNGIIENFLQIREDLESKGIEFKSETDTETLPQLITHHVNSGKTPLEAVIETVNLAEGAFAFGALFTGSDNTIIGSRRGAPLVVGLGDGCNYLASDPMAIAEHTNTFIFLENDDIVKITPTTVDVFNKEGKPVERTAEKLDISATMIGKGNYRHFMLKEIHEQPRVVAETVISLLDERRSEINLPEMPFNLAELPQITIVACGTSWHAGLVAKYWIEEFAKIQVNVDIASEFRYRNPPLQKGGLCIFISQSGETADSLAALEHVKESGQYVMGVINAQGSSIARESDAVIYTHAGPEISVASTKAFTTQLSVLAVFALKLAQERGAMDSLAIQNAIKELKELPARMTNLPQIDEDMQKLARRIMHAKSSLFLGRGSMFPIALEGALKLKEISYIHAEGYAAGEMKHGPIALIDEDVPVICLAPHDRLYEKNISNMKEVEARRGQAILFTDKQGVAEAGESSKRITIELPNMPAFVQPIYYTLPMQLLAYHVAVLKGTDVDQPRNLAKSVTVE